jgi:hypothetical protein
MATLMHAMRHSYCKELTSQRSSRGRKFWLPKTIKRHVINSIIRLYAFSAYQYNML